MYDPRPGATGPDDPGGGDYDPEAEFKIRDWYNDDTTEPEREAPPVTWSMIFDAWIQCELDLHAIFGVDVESGVLEERTWRWLELRIAACIGHGGHLTKAITKTLNR